MFTRDLGRQMINASREPRSAEEKVWQSIGATLMRFITFADVVIMQINECYGISYTIRKQHITTVAVVHWVIVTILEPS